MSKTIRLTLLAPLALAWMSVSALAQGGVVNSTKNPKQIAILHWYEANQTANFSVAADAVAFDGANIWLIDNHSFKVRKLRPSDGAVLGVFGDLLDTGPEKMVFDGANIWAYGQSLQKVRTRDGAFLGSFGTGPGDILFDGTNIWTTCGGCDIGTLRKIRPSDGVNVATFFFYMGAVTGRERVPGIAFDGTSLWVTLAGFDGNGVSVHNVIKVRPGDGAQLATFGVGNDPVGVAFDGASIWVANRGDNTVTKLRATDGVALGTFPVGTSPETLIFDGANIWVINSGSHDITKLRANDGVLVDTFPVNTTIGSLGIAFDGANLWVANGILKKF